RVLEERGYRRISGPLTVQICNEEHGQSTTLTVYELPGEGALVQPATELEVKANQMRFRAQAAGSYLLRYSWFPGWRAILNGQPVPLEDAHPGIIVHAPESGEVALTYRFRNYLLP